MIRSTLSEHEKSQNHMQTYKLCVEFRQRIRLGRTLNSENQKETKIKVGHWRVVVKTFSIHGFVSKRKRGKKDVLYDKNSGNFLKLLAFIGKFCVVSSDILRKTASNESYIHYREKNYQKLNHRATWIQNKEINFEGSHTFHISTFAVRFVWCFTGAEPCMKDHFLGFIPIEHSIGDALITKLLVQPAGRDEKSTEKYAWPKR
ncbi:hypothetical protein AVEN_21425-1 [Araneus ventricosus]|uniref:DUF4371 domain-containing protein n=1 Tax=Araneus ventricosus TaxID=182803 RepID=A0A4Y2W5H8_ARAVE|nr:hypothetical protein AVEN_21425-1 [Araneus ventricosus]